MDTADIITILQQILKPSCVLNTQQPQTLQRLSQLRFVCLLNKLLKSNKTIRNLLHLAEFKQLKRKLTNLPTYIYKNHIAKPFCVNFQIQTFGIVLHHFLSLSLTLSRSFSLPCQIYFSNILPL